MLDPIQILLTVIVTTLTVLLVVIGIEIFRILREAKKTIERTNRILDDVEEITNAVSRPVEGMASLVAGIKQGTAVVKVLGKLFHESKDDEESEE